MKVVDFVQSVKDGKVMNTKFEPDAVEQHIRGNLEIKEYIPFNEKRMIAEMVVDSNTEMVDGVKKYDNINSYIGFVVSMLKAHTNLEFSANPVADYDLLAESKMLMPIIETFRADYTECDVVLKMAVEHEMADNNVNAIVGRFLNGIAGKLDGVGEAIKSSIEKIDLNEFLGDIKPEDLAKLSGLLNKIK